MPRKKKNEVLDESVNRDDLSETEEEFVPEQVDEGVMRDEKKQNPTEKAMNTFKTRFKGNWKKVSYEEMMRLEKNGLLKGYDPETGEVLVK